jgi:thiol:disulfide interchange protein
MSPTKKKRPTVATATSDPSADDRWKAIEARGKEQRQKRKEAEARRQHARRDDEIERMIQEPSDVAHTATTVPTPPPAVVSQTAPPLTTQHPVRSLVWAILLLLFALGLLLNALGYNPVKSPCDSNPYGSACAGEVVDSTK